MINNTIGTLMSITFVFTIIVISEILRKKAKWKNEDTRKFIHIGVSHWWLFAMLTIDDIKFAIIPPILFIILNYISYKRNLFDSMERKEKGSDLGTIYFPISLLILVLFTWEGGFQELKYIGATGILIMGYGDGLAAIVGQKRGKHRYKIWGIKKSIEGSMAMFLLSFIVCIVILFVYKGYDISFIKIAIIIASVATLLEALTPKGMDNLSVPMITSLLLYFLIIVLNGSAVTELLFRASIGLIFSTAIAYGAYTKKSLSLSGAIGAIILGTGMAVTSWIYGSTIMILFFISSSLLSHYKKNKKKKVEKQFHKTGKRDIYQVLANGGIGLIYSILYFISKNPMFLILLSISFATANNDTWATEIGVLDKRNPISLRNFKKVDRGTSGAISFLGTLAGLAGSILIALFSVIIIILLNIKILDLNNVQVVLVVSTGGFIGGLIDSLLGATIQGIYFTEEEIETEKKIYNGQKTRLVRGFSIFNNDLINFLSITLSTIIFIGLL